MLQFNKIIAGLTKTITQLDTLAKKLDQVERTKTAKIKTLKLDCQAHEAERNACYNVAEKLKELVGTTEVK